MRKGIFLFAFILLFLLSGCETKVEPQKQEVEEETQISPVLYFDRINDYDVYREKEMIIHPDGIDFMLGDCIYNNDLVKFYVEIDDEYVLLEETFDMGLYTSSDLIDIGIPFTNCRKTNQPLNLLSSYEVWNGYEDLTSIREFSLIRYWGIVCSASVSPIIHQSFNFGSRNSGCNSDLDWVGYSILYEGNVYKLQDIVDEGYITTVEVYSYYYLTELEYTKLNNPNEWECMYDTCILETEFENKTLEVRYDIYSNLYKVYFIHDDTEKVIIQHGLGFIYVYSYDESGIIRNYTSCPLGYFDQCDEIPKEIIEIEDINGLKEHLENIFEEME